MTPLMQACIVLIAVSQIAFSIAAVLIAVRLGMAVANASRAIDLLDGLVKDMAHTSSEVRKVASGVEEITHRVKAVAARFERVGDKAASISSMVLDEVEAPVRNVTAMARGVRKGVAVVLERLTRRGGAAAYAGGNHNG